MIVHSSQIKNKKKLFRLTSQLVGQSKNIIIFGLPYTGKTTLAEAIQKVDKKRFLVDEWLTEQDTGFIQKQKSLIVTSQYLAVEKENTQQELEKYLFENGLKLDEWLIIMIHRD